MRNSEKKRRLSSLAYITCRRSKRQSLEWKPIIKTGPFLSRVSILLLTRDIDIVILSVRLSVRDTLVLYENGLTYRHSFSTIR